MAKQRKAYVTGGARTVRTRDSKCALPSVSDVTRTDDMYVTRTNWCTYGVQRRTGWLGSIPTSFLSIVPSVHTILVFNLLSLSCTTPIQMFLLSLCSWSIFFLSFDLDFPCVYDLTLSLSLFGCVRVLSFPLAYIDSQLSRSCIYS